MGVIARKVTIRASRPFTTNSGKEVIQSAQAWIIFENLEAAEKAFADCNGSVTVDGQEISCKIATQREKTGVHNTKDILIGNLDYRLEDRQIKLWFKDLPGFVSIRIPREDNG